MAAAIWETIHTFIWEAPAFPVIMLPSIPSVYFSSSESLCSLMIARIQPFEGRIEKERLANLVPLKNVAEMCLICFENLIYDVDTDYCK